ncbi:MAG: TIGR03943 family protein, partial [Anaerolineales bacterium]|nr:TIGR03943 family protein [Anaerolineales bacterium]
LFYISERFVSLTFWAGAGLVVVAGSYLLAQGSSGAKHEDHAEHVHDEHCDHNHDEHESHSHVQLNWVGLLIICVPLLLGVLVPPQPLGATALANREVDLGQTTAVDKYQTSNLQITLPPAPERTILEWLIAFDEEGFAEAVTDGPANVVGFVYRDERFGAEQFLVSRYVVSCCVADATPVGLVVSWPDTAVLTADSWVQVEGSFTLTDFAGKEVPVLEATRVTVVEAPTPVYLYELLAGE